MVTTNSVTIPNKVFVRVVNAIVVGSRPLSQALSSRNSPLAKQGRKKNAERQRFPLRKGGGAEGAGVVLERTNILMDCEPAEAELSCPVRQPPDATESSI